jgi:transcriptional regulator with XRE-family HTH domain
MARALLRLTTRQLAEAADVSKGTVISIEAGKRGHAGPVQRIRQYFESQGVYFIPALKEMHGPAVALRWGFDAPGARLERTASEQDDASGDLEASTWDEEEISFASHELAELQRHFSEAERWARLSDASKRAITRALGNMPLTN